MNAGFDRARTRWSLTHPEDFTECGTQNKCHLRMRFLALARARDLGMQARYLAQESHA